TGMVVGSYWEDIQAKIPKSMSEAKNYENNAEVMKTEETFFKALSNHPKLKGARDQVYATAREMAERIRNIAKSEKPSAEDSKHLRELAQFAQRATQAMVLIRTGEKLIDQYTTNVDKDFLVRVSGIGKQFDGEMQNWGRKAKERIYLKIAEEAVRYWQAWEKKFHTTFEHDKYVLRVSILLHSIEHIAKAMEPDFRRAYGEIMEAVKPHFLKSKGLRDHFIHESRAVKSLAKHPKPEKRLEISAEQVQKIIRYLQKNKQYLGSEGVANLYSNVSAFAGKVLGVTSKIDQAVNNLDQHLVGQEVNIEQYLVKEEKKIAGTGFAAAA
ncbi:MAG: hypothetical protein QGH47_01555, partial [Candidatus Woesearchaeota archaeon]|nr:hypothetical protein [Candidatus Woesearchaeota archaeon]